MDSNTYVGNFDASRGEHWWFSGREKVLATALERLSEGLPNLKILDYGAGTGANFPLFRRFGEVIGVEPSAEARQLARQDEISLFSPEDLAAMDKFNIVALIDVIEHVDDDVALLKDLGRRLDSDGKMLITVPAHPWLWNYNDLVSQHKRRYTKSQFLKTVEKAGYKIQTISYWNFTLLPAALVAAVLDYRRSRLPASAADQNVYLKKPGRFLNWIFKAILGFEACWMKKGLKLPNGISLIAILEKQEAR